MNLEKLISELQERNRKEYGCKEKNCELIGQYHGSLTDLDDLDQLTTDTTHAVALAVIGEIRKNMKDKPCYHFPLNEIEINKYLNTLEVKIKEND